MQLVRIFLFLNVILAFPSIGCELIVRFESYTDHAPQEQKDKHYGIDVLYAKALLNEAGCSYQFVDTAWGRAVDLLKRGKIDMMLSMSYTKERADFIEFIGPQRNETIVVATLNSFNEKLTKIEDIKELSKPIAVQEGALYGEAFNRYYQSLPQDKRNIIDLPNNHIKLSLLRKGRIIGFVEEKYNVLFQVQNNSAFSDIVVQPLVVNLTPVYIGLSKASVPIGLRIRLQKAFERLEARGVFASFINALEKTDQ